MLPDPAPYHAALADGPAGARAFWLTTRDGLRIRIGIWPGGTRGTVVLLPGRTEYLEKYGRAAADLVARGWSVIAPDWRGQGLSTRLLPDPDMGHVGAFTDYQLDLDAVLGWLADHGPAAGLSGPWMLLSHSMGGLIGLRAVMRGLPFGAAVFSAPMWGIRMPLWRRPIADMARRLPLSLPGDRHYAPTTSGQNYVLTKPFEGNHLTSDRAMWDYLHAQVSAVRELRLGGPSLGWLRTALRESVALMRAPAPRLPAIVALGSEERIVLPRPIHHRMAGWHGGRLAIYTDARHEVPMENPGFRERFFGEAVELFETRAAQIAA